MELNTVIRQAGGVTIISLEGKLRLGDATRHLRDLVKDYLAQGQKNLLLDLGKLDYMDSAGLGTLVACFSSTQNGGGKLKLLNLSKKAREQLVLTKLLTVFESFEDEATAVASFSAA